LAVIYTIRLAPKIGWKIPLKLQFKKANNSADCNVISIIGIMMVKILITILLGP